MILRFRARLPLTLICFVTGGCLTIFGLLPVNVLGFQGKSSSATAKKTSGKPKVESLDAVLEPIRAKHQIPALAAAIMQGDKISAIGAVGVRRIGSPEEVTIEDKFYLGSISKPITSTLIGMLVDRRKLTWKQTIGDAFPDLKEKVKREYLDVSLEQLLSHRSGLPEDLQPDRQTVVQLRALDGDMREQRKKLVEIVLQQEPSAAPGTKFIYSNFGYCVAATMAEQATEQTWENMLTEMLFKPLEMTSAGFGPPASSDAVDQPWGHKEESGSYSPASFDSPPCMGPSSRVHCSLTDLAKFGRLHLKYDKDTAKLLTRATYQKLHTDSMKQEYALGWAVRNLEWSKGEMQFHVGSNGVNYAGLYVVPGRDLVIVIATNAKNREAVDGLLETLVRNPVPTSKRK